MKRNQYTNYEAVRFLQVKVYKFHNYSQTNNSNFDCSLFCTKRSHSTSTDLFLLESMHNDKLQQEEETKGIFCKWSCQHCNNHYGSSAYLRQCLQQQLPGRGDSTLSLEFPRSKPRSSFGLFQREEPPAWYARTLRPADIPLLCWKSKIKCLTYS